MKYPIVRKAAVLGSGVMGTQIAVHLVNCGIPVILYDLKQESGDSCGIARKAILDLKKQRPSPLASPKLASSIEPANYEEDISRLADCELVIEVIAEKMEWKHALYDRIAPHLVPNTILASNTSGLSIEKLSSAIPDNLKKRFCGIHFFNPVRYMHLVELIPTSQTDPELLDEIETFFVSRLGKGVIRALDTPNFIANRIGAFSFLAAIHHAEQFGLGFDEVDAITGALIGRPKSATFRTLDIIGLDTFAMSLESTAKALPDDSWQEFMRVPRWLSKLITAGALGQKSGSGIYRKTDGVISVLDRSTGEYKKSAVEIDSELQEIMQLPDTQRLISLSKAGGKQAQFLWSLLRDQFHYCAVYLGDIAHSARDVDLAMRWGYGWTQGPFELWQASGFKLIADAIKNDITAGRTMSECALPVWVFSLEEGVHAKNGSLSGASGEIEVKPALPVYNSHIFPERLVGDAEQELGLTLFEEGGVRVWQLPNAQDVLIASLSGKGGTLSAEVVRGLSEAVAMAERLCRPLIIWRSRPPFSFGADLKSVQLLMKESSWNKIDTLVADYQQLCQSIKYAQIPVIAALDGMALGGGCELVMHCAKTVATLDSYIGLVESGVGLIPSGGGCKEFVLQASDLAERSAQNEPLPFIQKFFDCLFAGKVSSSAIDAKEKGFLNAEDGIIPHSNALLHNAIGQARALQQGWCPPLPRNDIQVAGRGGVAVLEMQLVNLHEGKRISDHDFTVGRALAVALCGGEIDGGQKVSESWLLNVERQQFIELLKLTPTQERISHILETGKPLRN